MFHSHGICSTSARKIRGFGKLKASVRVASPLACLCVTMAVLLVSSSATWETQATQNGFNLRLGSG